jgi:hypothetical protein
MYRSGSTGSKSAGSRSVWRGCRSRSRPGKVMQIRPDPYPVPDPQHCPYSSSPAKQDITSVLNESLAFDRVGHCGQNWTLLTVLRIHAILGWIRIRMWIFGSMPLTNGSGSCYFRHWRFFCLVIEGPRSGSEAGSGSIPLTDGSGSRRPKNMWIR